MRRFANDKSFQTRELPREALARARRATKGKNKNTVATPISSLGPPPIAPGPSGQAGSAAPPSNPSLSNRTPSVPGTDTRRLKALNLDTYKYHSLGDVASAIRRFGTTDSYSTEIVSLLSIIWAHHQLISLYKGELEHRTAKARYRRTNRKEYIKQVAQIERRQARLRRIREHTTAANKADNLSVRQFNNPETHHTIGRTENLPFQIGSFIQSYHGDPAIQVKVTLEFLSALPNQQGSILGLCSKIEEAPTASHQVNNLWPITASE